MSSEDLWQGARSWLRRYLDGAPDRERALRAAVAGDLNPADLMFRSLLLEEEGEFEVASTEADDALTRSYRPEYLRAARSEREHVASLVDVDDLVVDVASGRGALVTTLLETGHGRVVATDRSPLVLHRMVRRAAATRSPSPLATLAFDAGSVPLADRSVKTATTFLGLPNLSDAPAALAELRRVVTGRLLAVHYFAPGSSGVLDRERCMEMVTRAGWSARVEREILAPAEPTPVGVLVEGARIDGFPSETTELTWCVIVAE